MMARSTKAFASVTSSTGRRKRRQTGGKKAASVAERIGIAYILAMTKTSRQSPVTDTPELEGGAPPPSDIALISITDEMRKSYLDYAMSVIVSRALPDVRDGLKPVHRRILFSMNEQGYEWNRPYRKSARVVGDVIGKYHPHGNEAVYFSLVRMAQEFSLRVTLVDGQGNFGSVDGDMPAAMRYTEVRMERITNSLLDDLDKDTVDFKDNYDGSEQRADGAAGALPEPAGQWRRRHRRRHGDQHPDPQSRRGDRRHADGAGQPATPPSTS